MLPRTISKHLLRIVGSFRGEKIEEKLVELKHNQLMSKDEIEQLRVDKLKYLLRYGVSESLFYRDRYSVDMLNSINDFSGLSSFPILSKHELRDNAGDILLSPSRSRLFPSKTSGSTGSPFCFYKDTITRSYHYASMYRGHSWYGVGIGAREARLGCVSDGLLNVKGRLVDFALNRFKQGGQLVSENIWADYYNKILKNKPDFLSGYSQMIFEFARFLTENRYDLSAVDLKMIKFTSENMTNEQRVYISKTFNCPVVSEYGCAEVGVISFQCPKGLNHLSNDCLHVELLKNKDVSTELYDVVVTDLNSLSFPVVRYRIGDLVSIDNTICTCDLPLKCFGNVHGRESEVFIIDENRSVHSSTFNSMFKRYLEKSKDAIQYRVVQLGYKSFLIQIQKDFDRLNIVDFLEQIFRDEIGEDIYLSIEFVSNIPRENNGKVKLFVPYKGSEDTA
jgi:phenylacetate-CoA ligase